MRPAFRRKMEARRAKMAENERRNRLLLIAIVAGFAVLALALYLRTREPSGPVDVNRASIAELERLPEVGPAMAKAIVAGRPYASAEDLLKVKGIGPKTLEKIKPHVEFGE